MEPLKITKSASLRHFRPEYPLLPQIPLKMVASEVTWGHQDFFFVYCETSQKSWIKNYVKENSKTEAESFLNKLV